MFIYEAGAMTIHDQRNELHKAIEWRDKVDTWAKDNNVKTFNPMKTYIKEKAHTYNPKTFVEQNFYYLNKCDIMLVNLNDIDYSPGTQWELPQFKMMGKPIIAFGDEHWSPHINYSITQKVDTLEDALELLIVEFDQGNF